MSDLTDKLGFYFVVFQRTLKGDYIKCWIDGNEDFELYTRAELINFCNILGLDIETEIKLKKAFDETSIFLWDVEERKVKRLSATSELPKKNIFDALKDKTKEYQDGYVQFQNGVISVDNGRVIK